MLFRRLAVFVGGCTLEAVEAVCNACDDLGVEVLDGLTSLVAQSLIKQDESQGNSRFSMLETIREYSLECWEASDEAKAIRRQHAHFFLALATEAEPELRGAGQLVWLQRLDADHDNLRAALEWSHRETADANVGLQLTGTLWWFWFMQSRMSEGRIWLEQFAVLPQAMEAPSLRVKVLCGAGVFAHYSGDAVTAAIRFEETVTLAREVGDHRSLIMALGWPGMTRQQSEPEAARAMAEESLAIARDAGDTWDLAFALNAVAEVMRSQGDYERAVPLYEEGITLVSGAKCWEARSGRLNYGPSTVVLPLSWLH
jgi:hypothetical protein